MVQSYLMVKKILRITRFYTIYERDGRTDRPTPHDDMDRAYA